MRIATLAIKFSPTRRHRRIAIAAAVAITQIPIPATPIRRSAAISARSDASPPPWCVSLAAPGLRLPILARCTAGLEASGASPASAAPRGLDVPAAADTVIVGYHEFIAAATDLLHRRELLMARWQEVAGSQRHTPFSSMGAPPFLRELVWVSTDATGYLKEKTDATGRSFRFGMKVEFDERLTRRCYRPLCWWRPQETPMQLGSWISMVLSSTQCRIPMPEYDGQSRIMLVVLLACC